MKANSFNAHIGNTQQLRMQIFRDTSNQFMKVKSFNARNVNTKQLRKDTLRDT